ncbi:ArpU family phage packaging/lysis transcriptional regulator [Tetragenococcus halophilus]|uniref:Autolysin regulatory protein ArpU n=1 Tax=Tetragenococcus halophilus (strain DSM 20338 / JCM 20259 / NCIMB 9735 / NBRC 12172) TaxID=945021 RepID=A0AAN1SJ70_TETHN|nr:ArpU family phage packaging/lysis transcriptional regulator [Tetragenococcus halophilus]BAK95143.1 putative autolysin regulatory protein ArpU [Tetragenococcus halophilus NBRC 12172]GBD71112.1 putative autolysin regulatory protein ArpU [Tetragenococcus halophilus subsp. halophilus]
MGLLRDVDFNQTRKNAVNTLKNYRRLQRITGRSKIDIKSPIITDMPKSPSQGNKAEDALLQHINAESELNAIVAGLMSLPLTSRAVLYYSYCDKERWTNDLIGIEIGYSERQVRRVKEDALIEFAEAYKKGKLISYK